MNTRLEELKPVIWEEYPKRTLEELVYYLEQKHQLKVSRSSLEKFIGRSIQSRGSGKNVKEKAWVWADRMIRKRKLQGKDSDLFRQGQLIPIEKRRKEISRHVTTLTQITDRYVPSPSPPPGWVVRSPKVEVADADASTASTQSPSHGDFQRERVLECDFPDANIANDCLKPSITKPGAHSDLDFQAHSHVGESEPHQSEAQIEAQPSNQVPMSFTEVRTDIRNLIENDRDLNPVKNETSLDENLRVILKASHRHNSLTAIYYVPTKTVEQLIRRCRVIFSYFKLHRANFSLCYIKVVYAPNPPSLIAAPVSGFKKKFHPDVFEHALNILSSCCSHNPPNAQPEHTDSDNAYQRVGTVIWGIDDLQLRFKVFGAALTLTACQCDPKPVKTLMYHAHQQLSASAVSHVLFICSSQGNIDLLRLCWRMRFDLDSKLDGGATALYVAAVYNQIETVRFLLRRGVNVNAAAPDGRTVFATICNLPTHTMVCKLLVEGGADMGMTEKGESPATSQATTQGIDSQGTESTSRPQSDSTVVDQSIVESRHAAIRDRSAEPRPHRNTPASVTAPESQLHKPSAILLCAHPDTEPNHSEPLSATRSPRVSTRRDESLHRETTIADGVVESNIMLTAETLRLAVLSLSPDDEDGFNDTSSLLLSVLPPITSSLGEAIEGQPASPWSSSGVNALFSGSTSVVSKISLVEDVTPKPQIRRMNSPDIPEMGF